MQVYLNKGTAFSPQLLKEKRMGQAQEIEEEKGLKDVEKEIKWKENIFSVFKISVFILKMYVPNKVSQQANKQELRVIN